MNLVEKIKRADVPAAVTAVTAVAVTVLSAVDIFRYALLGEVTSFFTMAIVNCLFVLCAWGAHFSRFPLLNAPIAVSSAWLFSITNNIGTTLYNLTFLFQAILSAIGCLLGVFLFIRKRICPKRLVAWFCVAIVGACSILCGIWGINSILSDRKTRAGHEIWQVPDIFENADNEQKGRVERISYRTKAYATDKRAVEKQAYVYLPYGYDEERKYDILYLLHGSGDDEAYWLVENEWNKVMLDNLIEQKVIKPVIVVTPTFYVEEDCLGSLAEMEKLSYSFKDELRYDLMPAVESRYSTYADTIDEIGFIQSRGHRAFAGLSRGAVTTLRSVFCGCLDYFSSFGTFSASRTPVEYFQSNICSDRFRDYSIDYWYVASGNFDFGLSSQIQDYKALLKAEPRLKEGENTSLDVYPMRYHTQGNWHLALYNFLQIIY